MSSKAKAKAIPKSNRHAPTGKATPKQPLSIPERLKRLFTSLCAQIDGGHFANAVKTCDKILRLDPQDRDAHQTKLFLLLQTEKYDAALSLIDESGEHLFEKAYSLYRLNQEEEAGAVLEQVKEQRGDSDRACVHLEAQMAYRTGSYEHSVSLYTQLLETSEPASEEHTDIQTNLHASQSHLTFLTSGFLHALSGLPTSLISTLEALPPPAQQQQQQQQASRAAVPVPAQPPAAPEKKVRKSRVPAGVVPGVTPPPDPERWLKKSERSTFGTGRRRRGQGGAAQGSTQGSAGVEAPVPAAPPVAAPVSKPKGKKRK
ncbi:hypothetical protein DXG01_003285 [Tephrocybe rancida]|nr:hypothetical protein DXG01_003285 [Tephrocybe rancida]